MPDYDKLVVMGLLTLGPVRVNRMAEMVGWKCQRIFATVAELEAQGLVVGLQSCCSNPYHNTYGLVHGVKASPVDLGLKV